MSDPIGGVGSRIGQLGLDGSRKIDFLRRPDADGFGDTLKRAIGEVSSAQDQASDLTARFVRGEQVDLHQVMAATEEAGIALEMMVELRNKVTEAYRTLINMQS